MCEIKVSVVIPIYNAQKYIQQCVDSILMQTLKEIEIICVNDGSTDRSLEIIEEIQKKDQRVKIINQNNQGAGAARNKGLYQASGEYIIFLDADDFFEKKMLKEIYKIAKKKDAEIVVFTSDAYDELEQKRYKRDWGLQTDYLKKLKQPFSFHKIPDYIFNFTNGWAWDKMFKRTFIISNHLKFQQIQTTNDLYFVFASLIKAQRIMTVNKIYVHQRINVKNSLSGKRHKSWRCFFLALQSLYDLLAEIGCYKEVEKSFINFSVNYLIDLINDSDKDTYYEIFYYTNRIFFYKYNIDTNNKDYFYSKKNYDKIKQIKTSNPEEFLWNNFFKGLAATDELYEIKNSNTYKIAKKMSKIKKAIFG